MKNEQEVIPTSEYRGARERTDERDWTLAGGLIKLPTPPHSFAENQIQYSQREVSPVSCTLHSMIGAISDFTGYKFSVAQRKAIWAAQIEDGASEDWGDYLDHAVQTARSVINSWGILPELVYFRVVNCGADFWRALELGYSVATGYRGNANFDSDFLADGVLDGTKFGSPSYGHAIRITLDPDDPDTLNLVVDNYPERKYNIYKVKRATFEKLWANGVFFNSGYFFATREAFIDPLRKVSDWAREAVEAAVAAKIATQWDDPQAPITSSELEHILHNLGILTAIEGYLSKERAIVALKKMKLF